MHLTCPECGSDQFRAIEQMQVVYPCELLRGDDGQLEIDQDPFGEFQKEDGTSVTLLYTCAREECTFAVAPLDLESTFSAR